MKAIIIEDEIPASRHLQRILAETGGISVTAVLESVSETIDWFCNNPQPDIVFLDIHLADGNAFEIFNHVKISCPIIFTTAYDEYALKAFRVNSVDYLLKPVGKADVKAALRKLEELTHSGRENQALNDLIKTMTRPSKYKSGFLIPGKGSRLIPVLASDLACVYIDAGIVKAFTFDGKTYNFDHTLDQLAGMLDPDIFFRASRQCIVARTAIRDLEYWINGRLVVNLKIPFQGRIIISKARTGEFRNWFGK